MKGKGVEERGNVGCSRKGVGRDEVDDEEEKEEEIKERQGSRKRKGRM